MTNYWSEKSNYSKTRVKLPTIDPPGAEYQADGTSSRILKFGTSSQTFSQKLMEHYYFEYFFEDFIVFMVLLTSFRLFHEIPAADWF